MRRIRPGDWVAGVRWDDSAKQCWLRVGMVTSVTGEKRSLRTYQVLFEDGSTRDYRRRQLKPLRWVDVWMWASD